MVEKCWKLSWGGNSCPSPQGGTLHMASRMWEVIENSSRGADGSTRCGSICPMKWCKHNTQGVRDTILPCDDSMRGCRDGSSWTSCQIVRVSRSSWGQGVRRVSVDAGGPLNGGGCRLRAGAVVSLPTEPHSDVSSCRTAHKNGTKCFSLWHSRLASRWRNDNALTLLCLPTGPPPPQCSCHAFARHPATFSQRLFAAGRPRGKSEGRCWDNTQWTSRCCCWLGCY